MTMILNQRTRRRRPNFDSSSTMYSVCRLKLFLGHDLTCYISSAKKMASRGYRFGRLPWRKLCSDPQMYILPGSLPHAFQLKDPELLRVEEMAELWKHIHQQQQSGRLNALHFTDEVFKFDPSSQDEVVAQPSEDGKHRLEGDTQNHGTEDAESLHVGSTAQSGKRPYFVNLMGVRDSQSLNQRTRNACYSTKRRP